MIDEPRHPSQDSAPHPESYEPPRVEDVPTEDGPAVTAAGKSPPTDN